MKFMKYNFFHSYFGFQGKRDIKENIETRKKKTKTAKTFGLSIVLDRFNRQKKELMPL